MARFGKEEGTKKGQKKRGRTHGHNRSGFFTRTLTTPALVKGEGKVRGSEASLVNSGVIAECATPRSSAWGDRAYRRLPQLHTTYRSILMQKPNYE